MERLLYIDRVLRMIKFKIKDDGFLKDLHALLLMDDTVLFATSREKLIEKFNVVCDFCNSDGYKHGLLNNTDVHPEKYGKIMKRHNFHMRGTFWVFKHLNVGYRMFFHDRAQGETECEIMKKKHSITLGITWFGYWRIFRFFSKQKVLHFQKNWIQILPNPQFNFNDLKENR